MIIQSQHFAWTRSCFLTGDKPVAVAHMFASYC
jgi:hypothetical protein